MTENITVTDGRRAIRRADRVLLRVAFNGKTAFVAIPYSVALSLLDGFPRGTLLTGIDVSEDGSLVILATEPTP